MKSVSKNVLLLIPVKFSLSGVDSTQSRLALHVLPSVEQLAQRTGLNEVVVGMGLINAVKEAAGTLTGIPSTKFFDIRFSSGGAYVSVECMERLVEEKFAPVGE